VDVKEITELLASYSDEQFSDFMKRISEVRKTRKDREKALIKYAKDHPEHVPVW
jgi:hypothetical protein